MRSTQTIMTAATLLLAAAAGAGDVTTGNLTVTNDATIMGNLYFSSTVGGTNGGGTATGGTITTNGIYRVHTFTNVGTANFIVSGGSLICDVLVVGGGGGGGNGFAGGGGGAGGVLLRNSFVAAIGTYPIVVGVGGGSSTTYSEKGTNGTDSSFANILAYGGGGGGNGGSGGGGGRGGAGGTATNGQGYAGGTGPAGGYYPRGGGGGAGAVGVDGVSSNSGNGGIGISNDISGSFVYYAGGGGAGTDGTQPVIMNPGIGGLGGGGTGTTDDETATSGRANTGGGGGGGGYNGSFGTGGDGGSGIVIVRYLIGQAGSSNITTLTLSSTGIHQVNASGSNIFMGKVGIGTDSPAEKLHVSENVRIDGSLTLGGDPRSTWPSTAEGALMASSNLSDVADVAAARANLGLGSVATNEASAFLTPTSDGSQLINITAAQVGAVSTNAGALLAANNLSDVADAGDSRANLGLGSAATNETSAFLSPTGDGSQLIGITATQVGALSINGGTMNGAIIFPAAFGDIPMGVYTNR